MPRAHLLIDEGEVVRPGGRRRPPTRTGLTGAGDAVGTDEGVVGDAAQPKARTAIRPMTMIGFGRTTPPVDVSRQRTAEVNRIES